MSDIKKKLYCALVLVDENTEVLEHGAAIRFLDSNGIESTKQAPMFRLTGSPEEILEELTTRLANGFALIEPVLAPKEEKSLIVNPKDKQIKRAAKRLIKSS